MTRPRQLWLAVDWQDPAPALRTVSAFVHSVRAVDPVELTLASETLGEHDASTRLIALMREDADLAARWDRLPGILVHEGAVPGSVPPEDRLDAGSTSAERALNALRDELAPYVSVTPIRDRVDWARAWRPEPGFRAIAADNGSTDGTPEALRDAGAHVVTGEKPLGRVANWRAAMEAFRDGTDRPWMKWLFAGDQLDPGAADALDAALAAHPEAKLIVGAYYIRHPNGETRLWRTLPETRMVEPVESLLISTQHNWFGGPIGQALHRDVLDEVDFGAQPWVADWQSFLSVARTHPVLYVAEPMGVFDMTHRHYFLQHSQRVGSLVQELSLRMQSLDALKEIAHGPQLDQLEQELYVRAAQELGERVASQVARPAPRG